MTPSLASFDERSGPAPQLMRLGGSFWRMYGGRGTAHDLLACVALAEQQILIDQQEVVDCNNYQRVPVYHRELWYKLTVRRSQLALRVPEYGEGRLYQDGSQYGVADANAQHAVDLSFAKPLAELPLICSDMSVGETILVQGVDYSFDRDAQEIRFVVNPFDDPTFVRRPVYEDGAEVDEELDLLFHQSLWDWFYLQDHFGYLFGLTTLPSSPAAKRTTAALYEAIVGGCNRASAEELISACTDIPLARTSGETVEGIWSGDALVIWTDTNAYRLSPEAVPAVAVGDVLAAGQALCTGLQFFALNRGEAPAELEFYTLDRTILGGDYFDSLAFRNAETELVVEENVQGKTKVSFELFGFPPDAQTFWEEVHRRGIAQGQTLAEALDIRANPTTQPTAASLPTTINPVQFLTANILRFNTSAVLVRMNQLGPFADLQRLRTLRSVIPPWLSLLTILLTETSQDAVTISDLDGETTADYLAASEQDGYDVGVEGSTRAGYTQFSCQ